MQATAIVTMYLSDLHIYLQALYESATTGLTGAVGYAHTHMDFGDISLTANGQQVLYNKLM